jgi:hypothetical protein
MAREIGWSSEVRLLYEIKKALKGTTRPRTTTTTTTAG